MPWTKEQQIEKYGTTTEVMKKAFERSGGGSTYGRRHWKIKRIDESVPWPSDDALLKFADDGDLDNMPFHFGGKVEWNSEDDNYRDVTIYID